MYICVFVMQALQLLQECEHDVQRALDIVQTKGLSEGQSSYGTVTSTCTLLAIFNSTCITMTLQHKKWVGDFPQVLMHV